MPKWSTFVLGLVVGGAVVGLLWGRAFVPSAQAQHLSRLQNVTFNFSTTGTVSTLTFFDHDSGDLYMYVATGTGGFKFARKLSLAELGGPLADTVTPDHGAIPHLPTGAEPQNQPENQ